MKLLSLDQYLKRYGVTENTPIEKVNELKVSYRKWYQKEYGKLRRNKEKDIKVRMSLEEYQKLEKGASKHGFTKLSPFLKQMAFSYLEQRFIVPDDAKLQELSTQIQRIGNNINQLVHTAHSLRMYDAKQTYEGVYNEVKNLKIEVKKAVKQPSNIFQVLEDILKTDSDLIVFVEQIIEKIKEEKG